MTVALRRRHELALQRRDEIHHEARTGDAKTDLQPRLGSRRGMVEEHPLHAEVHVHDVGVQPVEQVGTQRVEVLQILHALTFDDYGWRTHPAVTMWGGHTAALVTYRVAISECWVVDGSSARQ